MMSEIQILPIEVFVHIGCTEVEQKVAQPILISLQVRSGSGFVASQTDQLTDTIDASSLILFLTQESKSIKVQTLEKFAQELIEGLLRMTNKIYWTNNENTLEFILTLEKKNFGYRYVQSARK